VQRGAAVMTPATSVFLPMVGEGDWAAALEVLDRHWVEIWFAVDPVDLREILAEAPGHLLASLRNADSIAGALGHRCAGVRHPGVLPHEAASLPDVARTVTRLRLQERPVAAMAHVPGALAVYRAQRGRLVDATGGEAALWLVQAATTALLAGEVAAAQGILLSAVDVHETPRFPFVLRYVTAERALTLAVGGNVAEARHVVRQGYAMPRTGSWVESVVDRVLWLADFICAVDTLDERTEEMRLDNPSPLSHRELWPVALLAHVRYLTLTGRPQLAEELCDAVAAVDLAAADADGLFASAVADARLLVRPQRGDAGPEDRASVAQTVLARALRLFVTGQFAAVTRLTLPRTHDNRLVRAMALLRAQATIAQGRAREGQQLLLETLHEVLDCQTYSVLTYLTRESLDAIGETDPGARAAELVERHSLPLVRVGATLTAALTKAETAVLRLLCDGLTREEIAKELFLSVNTVKTHLRSAYRKLGVTHRVEALEASAQLGI